MLAINVQESTATTGTGDITLAGGSEDGRTFNSQFGTNERLSYYIDDRAGNWEHGIGYLSDSTTLVRDELLDSSTGSVINFTAGTKQVFVGVGLVNATAYPTKPADSVVTNKVITSSHISNTGGSSGIDIDTIHYVPFIVDTTVDIQSIGLYISSNGAGASCFCGLYDTDKDGNPNKLIITGSPDVTTSGLSLGSITPQKVKAGKYFFALWCDVAISGRSFAWYYASDTGMAGNNYEGRPHSAITVDATGLTELPTTAITPTNVKGKSYFIPFLGV